MPYRRLSNSPTWHWCYNCSGWPLSRFRQREDKPPTWNEQSLCEACASDGQPEGTENPGEGTREYGAVRPPCGANPNGSVSVTGLSSA